MGLKKAATLAVSLLLATSAGAALVPGSPASATTVSAGPVTGDPWVVSLGDSYISGEAGRWAGNTGGTDEPRIDALGSTAYFDNATNTAETINRCHRSHSAEVYLGGGVNGNNLACSGATTNSHFDSNSNFKPGLDQYADTSGNIGQTGLLRDFAKTHNVRAVVVSVGGNNFGFADTIQQCVTDWLFSTRTSPDVCQDDNSVTSRFSSTAVAADRAAVAQALKNVDLAMQQAGYTSSQWSLILQNYPSPIERSTEARYGDWGTTPQSTGGCGFWRSDLDWANDYALPTINNAIWGAATDSGLTNITRLDISHAMDNHKLCQRGVTLAEDLGYSSPWANADVPNGEEWINQIHTASTANTDFYIQESLHPNYWGQLALRNCLRQAYNGGNPVSGSCQPSYSWGKNANGEPNMTFSSTYAAGYQPPHRGFNIGGMPSKRCVDIPGGSTSSGTVLALYDCNGNWNQNFGYNQSTQQISGQGVNLCLGLKNNGTGAGTNVIMQTCDTTNALQRWTLGADQRILNNSTGLCIDANGGGTGNGTTLLVWGCGTQANQKWWY